MAKELADIIAISDEDVAALFAAGTESKLQVLAIADELDLKFASINERDRFGEAWRSEPLRPNLERNGWFEIDLEDLHLDDDVYEYEFVVHRNGKQIIAADPFAEEITRFGGYRGVFRIKNGKRWRLPFSWAGEISAANPLPNNHEMVIYEMPMRWMDDAPEDLREVALGPFEATVFEHLDELQELGINCSRFRIRPTRSIGAMGHGSFLPRTSTWVVQST
jgi:1,4-alpha-glucan branching enzyme